MKLFIENIKLRLSKNTFQNKYHLANEELVEVYRKKDKLAEERDSYKKTALELKEEYRQLKKEKAIIQEELQKVEQQLKLQNQKNIKLTQQLAKKQQNRSATK